MKPFDRMRELLGEIIEGYRAGGAGYYGSSDEVCAWEEVSGHEFDLGLSWEDDRDAVNYFTKANGDEIAEYYLARLLPKWESWEFVFTGLAWAYGTWRGVVTSEGIVELDDDIERPLVGWHSLQEFVLRNFKN